MISVVLLSRVGHNLVVKYVAHRYYLPSALSTWILYNKSKKMTSNFVYNGNLASIIHEMGYNGLPVCAMCERVNRYTVIFVCILTTKFFYGNTRMEENSC